MIYLDVDAVCKLSHWKILPLLPELLGYHWSDIKTVSSLSYRIKKSLLQPDRKLFLSSDAAKVASECVAQMGTLENSEFLLLEQLVEIPQIDPGEATLLAAAYQDPVGIFITGDKRALRALAAHLMAKQFAGKILCLEQVLEHCLRIKGRDWYLRNVCPQRLADKAISNTLGVECDASLDDIEAGLGSYISEMGRLGNPPILSRIS